MLHIFGVHDRLLITLEEIFGVTIKARGEQVDLVGDEKKVQNVASFIHQVEQLLASNEVISERDVMTAARMAKNDQLDRFIDLYQKPICKTYDGKTIRPKTLGQKKYIDAVKKYPVVFGIGPAGTGKTFLAVVMAVAALKKGEVQRIILTRPAVEAGESLGYLPGDLKEKVDPYLRPVYDALYAIYGVEHTERLIERNVVEIAPLAYMRGRTLDDAFIILDEAQNTTQAQMKMFLTRLGFGSKMIINGDRTQIDLPYKVKSGLVDAENLLQRIEDICFIRFDTSDVVRHPVVAQIIDAYESHNE